MLYVFLLLTVGAHFNTDYSSALHCTFLKMQDPQDVNDGLP
jgi:hypothetical protein